MKGHRDDGLENLGGKAERSGTAQPGEEKAQRNLINVFKYLEGRCKEERARLSPVMPADRTKWKHRSFLWNIRKHFFLVKMTALTQIALRSCGVSTLGEAQKLFLGNYLWVALPEWRCSTRRLQDFPSNLNHSM